MGKTYDFNQARLLDCEGTKKTSFLATFQEEFTFHPKNTYPVNWGCFVLIDRIRVFDWWHCQKLDDSLYYTVGAIHFLQPNYKSSQRVEKTPKVTEQLLALP